MPHAAASCCRTDRGLIRVDRNIVHLVEVVVQEALLRVGLDDLAQGLPAQLFGRQSWRLTVYPLRRPEEEKERETGIERRKKRNEEKAWGVWF